jgi:hypothetical protein
MSVARGPRDSARWRRHARLEKSIAGPARMEFG